MEILPRRVPWWEKTTNHWYIWHCKEVLPCFWLPCFILYHLLICTKSSIPLHRCPQGSPNRSVLHRPRQFNQIVAPSCWTTTNSPTLYISIFIFQASSITAQLPPADIYVMKAEATSLRAAGSDPSNIKTIAVNLQKAQMIAMIVALINSSGDALWVKKDAKRFTKQIYIDDI